MSFLSFVLDKMTKILTIVFVCGTVAVVLSFLLSVREATVCSAEFQNGFKYFLKKCGDRQCDGHHQLDFTQEMLIQDRFYI